VTVHVDTPSESNKEKMLAETIFFEFNKKILELWQSTMFFDSLWHQGLFSNDLLKSTTFSYPLIWIYLYVRASSISTSTQLKHHQAENFSIELCLQPVDLKSLLELAPSK
jgi:hypothetical protein